MNRTLAVIAAVLAVCVVYGENGGNGTVPWYAPFNGDGWKGTDAGKLKIEMKGPDGKPIVNEYKVEDDGTSPELDAVIKIADESSPFLGMAYRAIREGLAAQIMVKNTSDNLDDLFAGGTAETENSDKTSGTGTFSFTRGADGKLKMTLTGVNTVKAGGGLEKNDGTMRLKDWQVGSKFQKTLGEALSGDRDAQVLIGGHEVLARSAPNGELDYIKIGKIDDAGVEVDDKTIVSNAQGKLELKGWKGASDKEERSLPYVQSQNDGLLWGAASSLFDPLAFAAQEGSGLVGLFGWEAPTATGTLSEMLTDADAEYRDSMYVLARKPVGGTEYAALGYIPIGDVIEGGGMRVDGKSIVTNATADGSASVAGAAGAAAGFVPYSDGDGGLSWDYATPTVAWDSSSDTLTIITPREDGAEATVVLPRISVEEEDGEDETIYTLSWRDLDGAEITETEIAVPKRAAVSPDNESVVTNGGEVAVRGWEDNKATKYAVPHSGGDALAWRGFGDFFESATFDWTSGTGKVAPKGYGAGVGNLHYFGTGANGGVGWWELPNVTTNSVQSDGVTITSTTAGVVKTLGLKGWNANYGGNFPLFLVNDRGALGYYPLPEPVTNEWDNASIYSNAQNKVEIKGFATGTPHCNANLYSMLTNTATAYPEKSKHLLLSRYKDGNADPVLHWIPFPAGALETGGGTSGGALADGITIVTNAAQGAATQGMASVAGYSTATNGTVLTRTANGVEWKPVAATSGSFAYSGGRIGAGAVTVGRQTYKVNESGTAASSGNWRVKVVLDTDGGDPTITVESGDGFAAPTEIRTSYFPLYELDAYGNVVHDWRGTFVVPAYEQGSYL